MCNDYLIRRESFRQKVRNKVHQGKTQREGGCNEVRKSR